jgi:hypothetical protein
MNGGCVIMKKSILSFARTPPCSGVPILGRAGLPRHARGCDRAGLLGLNGLLPAPFLFLNIF